MTITSTPQRGVATPDAEHVWHAPHRTDLRRTLAPLRRGSGDPTQRLAAVRGGEECAVWLTQHTDAGAAALRIANRGGEFRAEAWGPGAGAALASAPALCGAEDDDRGFIPGSPALDRAHRERAATRLCRSLRLFEALVPVVIEQKVIAEQAQQAYRSLVWKFGSAAPGPVGERMRVSPTPAAWQRVPSWEWHRAGVDATRSRTVVRLAERASAIQRLVALEPEVVRERLCLLPGVGAWTAAEVAQRALGDADAVSVGDFHLAKRIGHALAGRDFSDAEMMQALEPWRGHRYRAVRAILAAGPRRQARGPRLALVDYRGI